MFIFTAKLNKKRAIIGILLFAVLICAIILVAGIRSAVSTEADSLSAIVKTNEQRVQYLNALGWEVEATPLEEQDILIPREFSGVYETYNDLQKQQGFDLSDYCGMEATRYTYKVTNYGGEEMVVADLIVCQDVVIAGDIQSTGLDGFMQELKK